MINKLRIVILVILCAILVACGAKTESINTDFYFIQSQEDYFLDQGSICAEKRSLAVEPHNIESILQTYLKGPKSSDLTTPFPEETALIRFSTDQASAQIVLSESFSKLTGIDLTLACTCICLTVHELTGYSNVIISAQNTLLDGRKTIDMNANDIILQDKLN